ncbi:polysaccharide deacetylase family protein [Mesobacillus subterraneus]|uniref:polysaccharide deacetylase family protein n=1 Tax=Mesobacillus subterraneus TaxID=285983 RepID=UPI001CFD2D14|nr:polysaccharide deacetylase family protein [Mesobacillus subterraneus]
MLSLNSKIARWCTVVCLVGGLITSSSAVASQVKKPIIQQPSQQQKHKSAYNHSDEVLKKLGTKPTRFTDSETQLINQPTPDTAENPAEDTANAPSKTVYLTFDDGPHKISDQILSILDEFDAKATFFMLDGNIRNFPEAVKRMAESGHSLGAHGVTHDKMKIYQSPQTVVAEMDQTLSTIKEITGIDSTLIRTPYGSVPYMKDHYKKAVSDKGYQLWDWNVDSKDWYYRDKRLVDYTIVQVAEKAKKDEPLVILLHEREETLSQLPELLEYLKELNYNFEGLNAGMTPIHLK